MWFISWLVLIDRENDRRCEIRNQTLTEWHLGISLVVSLGLNPAMGSMPMEKMMLIIMPCNGITVHQMNTVIDCDCDCEERALRAQMLLSLTITTHDDYKDCGVGWILWNTPL